ncbi:hypothetical protein [Mastigocoleus testarum]|uniref:Uncharacterized protein n=1 Tax=Mastigocoleus testarum BC008 TaxID=371196 RepID=A0A0V7ZS84_9CYAN|nr:hypothetical protein [Mastigocoleus testarum]KST64858.1 hypothetical protein BC008_18775 [Mastigocoleus testarum BC008]KST67062.1 hypothetical protein BC008_28140 [Mastigocoleus testarum BC008]
MNPASIDEWFPTEQQRKYISLLRGQTNLTRRRAECFVKLWAYLLVKQYDESGNNLELPLTKLLAPKGFIPCTHKEAHELFYSTQERGSERAAGMMMDKLATIGLIEKEFDGNTTCVRVISPLTNLNDTVQPKKSVEVFADVFEPRIDTIPVSSYLRHHFNFGNNTAASHRIARILRNWSKQSSAIMRVLRRCDNNYPVGFYVLYPVAKESEENYFTSPRHSLYFSVNSDSDPIKMAVPGDTNCTCIHIRGWYIEPDYLNFNNICKFLEDGKQSLTKMQADFPELCDMYTIPLQPIYEQLATALGFHKIESDPHSSVSWMYIAVDNYLKLELTKVLSVLKFN